MQEVCDSVTIRQASALLGQDLEDFLIEKFLVRVKEWDEVLVELEKYVIEEEELEREEIQKEVEAAEMVRVMKETIHEALAEEKTKRRAEVGPRIYYRTRSIGSECFVCGRTGHIARVCSLRRGRSEMDSSNDNNKKFNSLCVRGKEVLEIEERGETGHKEEISKRFRSGMNLETVTKMFPEVLMASDRQIEYKTGEKCYIRTVRGEKVVRRGQIVSQSLRSKTKQYFLDLEARGIIRKSRSDWRNPIRAIEKPDGEVRVVSNLMGLNDLVEKDPYTLPTIRDIIQKTQGSNVFTVIDLKEGFYHIEIE
ncbi:Retrovirus-related Pol polyprotein from transposon, partial [Nosema granulosis]